MTTDARLDALRTPAGAFAMLAIDQRESLRAMYPRDADGAWPSDEVLRTFKEIAVAEMSSHASGLLIDRPLGLAGGRPAGLADDTGLIVAADVFHQVTGELMTHSTVDQLVTPAFLDEVGAVAVKYLILWRPGQPAGERRRILDEFNELASRAGRSTLIEGVVRTDHDEPWASEAQRHDAILAAAAEFAEAGPSIYKAEVPGYTAGGDVARVREQAAELDRLVGEWVVLSNGVEPEYFGAALTEAVAGGAHGFLAGRAVWRDIVGESDVAGAMADRGVQRLDDLRAIAEAHAGVER
jgi:sulfofructosephosphate aldolase